MSVMVPLALWGWMPLCILLFAFLKPRQALLVAFLGGWLFLPVAGYKIEGLPDYTRMTAIGLGALLGAAIFDTGRLLSFRPGWIDLPMIVWILCPFPTCLLNGIGAYGGMSLMLDQATIWGLPYFLGRTYLTDLPALRDLAIAIFVGGLIYVPLCLIEIRLSPQLHNWVYGFRPDFFGQTIRFGGYRPVVFMQHGLAVGMFMTAASLLGVWLWVTGSLKNLRGIPMVWLVPVLLIVTVLCKSTGALILLIWGLGCLFFTKWTGWRVALIVLALLPPTYMATRTAHLWTGETIVNLVHDVLGEDRAGSIKTRLDSEDLFTTKAMRRPIFGWSAWNRFQVFDERGNTVTIPDGLWVIALGQFGLVGLVSFTAIFLTPVYHLLRRYPPRSWLTPQVGPAAALTLIVVLWLIDCLPNGMLNPLFTLAIGGLCTTLPRFRAAAAPRRRTTAAQHTTPPQPALSAHASAASPAPDTPPARG